MTNAPATFPAPPQVSSGPATCVRRLLANRQGGLWLALILAVSLLFITPVQSADEPKKPPVALERKLVGGRELDRGSAGRR